MTTKEIEALAVGEAEGATRELNRTARNASGRKPSRKTEGVQEKILDAAAKVFAQKGYQLTKLTDIADEVGVHVTALRYHFPTKDVLVEEMINSLTRQLHVRLLATLQQLPPETPYRERIEAAAITYLNTTLTKLDYIAAHGNVINQIPQDVRDRHFILLDATNKIWRDLMAAAAEAGELRAGINVSLANQVLQGTLIWTREWYKPGRLTPTQLAIDILDVLFGGLAPRD
ncbi:TetR/AcrR family transcriptional regulator [Mesorhizobium sp. ANAO-SY3R2]|uniref:TetR/AcrR family transcriptional regulator n=1 Tax=Mesorhizobium sp. ANAO-SY3R2 TaxID=3166644 RepID=UPI00366C6D93